MSRKSEEHEQMYKKTQDDDSAIRLMTKQSVASSILKTQLTDNDPILLAQVNKMNEMKLKFRDNRINQNNIANEPIEENGQ